jgi:hypothetical protein
VAEADVSRFGRLARSSGRSSHSCLAGTDDGDACGCHDLVGGIIEESMRLRFLLRRETSDPQDRAMKALVCVFLLLGGIISESTLLGDR